MSVINLVVVMERPMTVRTITPYLLTILNDDLLFLEPSIKWLGHGFLLPNEMYNTIFQLPYLDRSIWQRNVVHSAKDLYQIARGLFPFCFFKQIARYS